MTAVNSPDQSLIEDEGSEQDSAVIKELRSKNKDLARQNKDLEHQVSTARDQILAEVQREQSAHQLVSELGFPKLGSLVAEKIQGDLTSDNVKSFLEGIGLVAQAEQPGTSGGTLLPGFTGA